MYVVDLFFDDLTADNALEEITRHKSEKIVQDLNVKTEQKTDWNYTNQKRATTIFPLLSTQSFERENAVTF